MGHVKKITRRRRRSCALVSTAASIKAPPIANWEMTPARRHTLKFLFLLIIKETPVPLIIRHI